jgi:hypothetical protein
LRAKFGEAKKVDRVGEGPSTKGSQLKKVQTVRVADCLQVRRDEMSESWTLEDTLRAQTKRSEETDDEFAANPRANGSPRVLGGGQDGRGGRG